MSVNPPPGTPAIPGTPASRLQTVQPGVVAPSPDPGIVTAPGAPVGLPNPTQAGLSAAQQAGQIFQPVAQALSQNSQPGSVSLTPQDLQQVQQGVQTAAAPLADPSKISPNSPLVKQATGGAVEKGLGLAGNLKQDAFAAFIKPLIDNPIQSLGLLGLGIGAEVLTGGAATPFLIAAGAALALPGAVDAISAEVTDPSDANLSKAIINVGVFATSALPGRKYVGAGAREAMERNVTAFHNANHPDEIAQALGAKPWQNLKQGVPLRQQVDVLAFDPTQMKAQLAGRMKGAAQAGGIDGQTIDDFLAKHKDKSVRQITEVANRVEGKTAAILDVQRQIAEGEIEAGAGQEIIATHLADLNKVLQEEYLPLRWAVSYTQRFLPAEHGAHMGFDVSAEEQAVPGFDAAMKSSEGIKAIIEEAARHRFPDGNSVGAAGAMEQLQYLRAADARLNLEQLMMQRIVEVGQHLGLTPARFDSKTHALLDAGSPEWEEALQAVEEPEVWAEASPTTRVLARAIRDINDHVTVSAMRHGLMGTPQESAVPHFLAPAAAPAELPGLRDALAPHESAVHSRNKTWQLVADISEGKVQMRMTAQTRRKLAAELEDRKNSIDRSLKVEDLMDRHGETIDALRSQFKRSLPSRTRAYAALIARRQRELEQSPYQATEAGYQQTLSRLQARHQAASDYIASGEAEAKAKAEQAAQQAQETGAEPPAVAPAPAMSATARADREIIQLDRKIADLKKQVLADPSNIGLRSELVDSQSQMRSLEQTKRDLGSMKTLGGRIKDVSGQIERSRLRKPRARLAEAEAKHKAALAEQEDWTKKVLPAELKKLPKEDRDLAEELITAKSEVVRSAKEANPSSQRLLMGFEHLQRQVALFASQMEFAATRNVLETSAAAGVQMLRDHLGPEANLRSAGAILEHPYFKLDKSRLPLSLPASVAKNMPQYTQVVPAVGRTSDLFHREGVYMLEKPGQELKAALDKPSTSREFEKGVISSVYKLSQGTRRVIMALPFFHLTNLIPRLLTMFMQDPRGSVSVLKDILPDLQDPARKAALSTRFVMSGGMHANRFNIGKQLAHLLEEDTGEKHWSSMRALPGVQSLKVMHDQMEHSFWGSVHDMQLFLFRYAEETMRGKVPEGELGEAASTFANHVSGFVNPIYMNNVYRQVRGLVWFAPSYVGSFGSLLASLGPSRLSEALATMGGGKMVRFSGVPLRYISSATRKELLRAQRFYTLSYLANGVAMANLANTAFSGHPMWENDPGHRMDISLDRLVHPEQVTGGGTKSAYVSGLGWYRQVNDVVTALGIGHDWGLAGTLNSDTFAQLNLAQKAAALGGGLIAGVSRTALGKASPALEAGFEMLNPGGQSWASLEDGINVNLPGGRAGAVFNFLPAGNQILSGLNLYQQEIAAQSDPAKQQQLFKQSLMDVGLGGLQALSGIPSVHYLAAGRPQVGDDKFQQWQQTRQDNRTHLSQLSTEVMNGGLSFYDYAQAKEQIMQRMIQADADTFGTESPVIKSLADARSNLTAAFGLNDPSLAGNAWYAQYSAFEQEWESLLEMASPQARSAWWDVERQNWTDADYLQWMAKQAKQAIASSIDGQGGNHILAYERRIGSALSQPISVATRTLLENGDPYYAQYRATLRNIRGQSPLGALIGAFTSQMSNTMVLPPGQDPQQLLAQLGPQASVLLPGTVQKLVQEAKQMAAAPDVEQSGGTVSPSDIGLESAQ